MQLDPRPTKNNQLSCSSLPTKFCSAILIIHGMTFKFEYLSKFKFIFKKNLGLESGDKVGSIDEKKSEVKKSCVGVSLRHTLL
jgi:hypothetical protein